MFTRERVIRHHETTGGHLPNLLFVSNASGSGNRTCMPSQEKESGDDIIPRIMKKFLTGSACIVAVALVASCKNTTPVDSKYIKDLHETRFLLPTNEIEEDNLSLYVDYSTCIAEGMKTSAFYQKLVPSFVEATKSFYSIKGDVIAKEEPADTYNRLLNIDEVNYADLKTAAEQIANSDVETALLTDGEYYNPTKAGANPNNPYLTKAFKTWMQKGHDIFIISEPYVETHRGIEYNKKRFYFLFTDIRLKNNIYDRIVGTVHLAQFPGVQVFHLSADHPRIMAGGKSSEPNEMLGANVESFGSYEVQDWTVGWKPINNFIMGAVNEQTGEPLPNGDFVIRGLNVDRRSFGGYEIEDVDVKVYDLNMAYMDYYMRKEAGLGTDSVDFNLPECANFLRVDHKEFERSGMVSLYFDVQNLDNYFLKYGKPNNYFKIDLFITKTRNVFPSHSSMFTFDLLGEPGATNLSIVSSVEQCLVDKDLENRMKSSPFYTIYVKSDKY